MDREISLIAACSSTPRNIDGRCSEDSHSKQWIQVESRRSNDQQTCAQQTSEEPSLDKRCARDKGREGEKEKNRYVPTDSRAPIRGEKSRMKTADDWCRRNVYTSVCVYVCVRACVCTYICAPLLSSHVPL